MLPRKFEEDFIVTRSEILNEILETKNTWNKFLSYWSKILDSYSVDNILNLYSYNPYGKIFHTFDEWNSDVIERRIKPKSKGIPILQNDRKVYVFDIKQTYGKDYNQWNYNHLIDLESLSYYQDKYQILNDSKLNINDRFYNIFYEISKTQLNNNYLSLNNNEVEFIANTMTSLFLSKINFNIYNYDRSFFNTKELDEEEILKCMQVANKETAIIYNDFMKNAIALEKIHLNIKDTIIQQYKNNNFIPNSDREGYLQAIEISTGYNYELLNEIYNYLLSKYSYIKVKKEKGIIEETQVSLITNKQLSLFEEREITLANKICDIFNSFDTKYQNTFSVRKVELQRWEHISSKKRNLTILLTSPLADDMGENSFSYFNTDKTDEIKLNDGIINNYFLNKLSKDKDFDILFSPNIIHIYWHNFDSKEFDLNIPSTKLVDEKEIDNQILEEIDKEVSSIIDNEIDYKVTTAEIIPTRSGIETNVIEEHSYNKDGIEVEEKYPKINYHISDDKVDTTFGAKSRFDDNVKAIELLKQLELEDRNATKEEQDILSRYVGWGGISDAFDERKDNWKKERNQLKELLSEKEYKDASHSIFILQLQVLNFINLYRC